MVLSVAGKIEHIIQVIGSMVTVLANVHAPCSSVVPKQEKKGKKKKKERKKEKKKSDKTSGSSRKLV